MFKVRSQRSMSQDQRSRSQRKVLHGVVIKAEKDWRGSDGLKLQCIRNCLVFQLVLRHCCTYQPCYTASLLRFLAFSIPCIFTQPNGMTLWRTCTPAVNHRTRDQQSAASYRQSPSNIRRRVDSALFYCIHCRPIRHKAPVKNVDGNPRSLSITTSFYVWTTHSSPLKPAQSFLFTFPLQTSFHRRL